MSFRVFDWQTSTFTEGEAAEDRAGLGPAIYMGLKSALDSAVVDVTDCSGDSFFDGAIFHSGYEASWRINDDFGTP